MQVGEQMLSPEVVAIVVAPACWRTCRAELQHKLKICLGLRNEVELRMSGAK